VVVCCARLRSYAFQSRPSLLFIAISTYVLSGGAFTSVVVEIILRLHDGAQSWH